MPCVVVLPCVVLARRSLPHPELTFTRAGRGDPGRLVQVNSAGGYADFLDAIADPSHDEHAAMWQWSGGPFDATGFDVNATNATNAALRRLR